MKLYTSGFKTLLLFSLLFTLSVHSFGQNYGLGISTSDVSKETNTALDLSSDRPICLDGNFEISFDVSSLSKANIFGYIFRIIEDNERNFDLVYNADDPEGHFNVVVGDRQTKIKFNIPPNTFLRQWNKISIKFDTDRDKLIVSDGHSTYIEGGLHLKKKRCYKLYFGSNSDKKFKTNEALALKYRDIRIKKEGIIKYYWPLDEHKGDVAHELINENNGSVKNPIWMTSRHQNWRKVSDFIVKGIASTAFDSKKELLFIIAEDSLFTLSLSNWALSSKSNRGKFKMNYGNQSVYNLTDNTIYNFLADLHIVAGYSMTSQRWNKQLPHWKLTDYWHANKVISLSDSSIYVLGGYGNWKYKNAVKRFSLKNEKWEDIKPKGDFFTPRYLSALGSNTQGDTIYVLGGFGSASGLQAVNPKNIYSMMRFTTKDKTFKKLYELKNDGEDFAFANSLIIDNSSKTYYGLAFPQRRYNSNLRLISGSLNNNSYKLIGSAIPYSFHDTYSFADLFYSSESKKFIAVTLLTMSKEHQTKVSIYTLDGPPLDLIKSTPSTKDHRLLLVIGLALFIALLIGSLLFYLARRKNPGSTAQEILYPESNAEPNITAGNAIFLFGDLQVFDGNGSDITKIFTPLLKELFLLLLVNSVKNGRGLHSEKLDETLWFGKSEQSVRNNRSVNIAKLKSVLETMDHCQLVKNAGYWKIELDYDFWHVDYQQYLNLIEVKKKLDEEQIKLLFKLTRRGKFLSNHNYEWLDQFKADISNEVIDVFLDYANSTKPDNPEFLIQIANFIFYFDPVSEEAMVIKCKALSSLGKHSLAKTAYDAFVKDYRSIYNEDFDKNFNQIT